MARKGFTRGWLNGAMKRPRSLLSCLVPAILCCVHAMRGEDNPYLNTSAEVPQDHRGQVTLPLPDWQSVWKAATEATREPTPAAKPPLSATLQSADYRARIDGRVLRCEAAFRVQSFTKEWQVVPLVGGEWLVEPSPQSADVHCTLVRQEQNLCALVQGEGEFDIKLSLLTSLSGSPLSGKIGFFPAATQRWSMPQPGAGQVLRIDGAEPVVGSGDEWLYPLPVVESQMTVSLEEAPPPLPPPAPPKPSTWLADSQVAAVHSDGWLRCTARVFVRADDGSGLSATLKLPAAALVDEVTGDDLGEWIQRRSADGSQRLVEVRWKTRDLLNRTLNVRYALPQSPVATEWMWFAPVADQAGRAVFVMAAPEGAELQHASLQRMAGSQVLAWIREALSAQELFAVEGTDSVKVGLKVLPRLETARATITNAEGRTRLTADGSALHDLTYEITHRSVLAWTVRVGDAETILRCQVNGTDVRPVAREKGGMEFSLPSPTDGSQLTTKISISYHRKGTAWDRVSGQTLLELPRTDLLTQKLGWQVELPEGYEVAALEGNATPVRAESGGTTVRLAAFQKELFSDEAPAVEIFYQRKDVAP